MKYAGFALATLLILASAGDETTRGLRSPANPTPSTSLGVGVPEPPNAPVRVGDRAPEFSWSATDGRPHRLRDILEQAHTVIVFAADDRVLQSLEMERESLADLGVVPVAILEGRAGGVIARARRLGLHYLVVPDQRHIIASQYDVLEPRTERPLPSWFAVDRNGIVRSQWHESLPTQGWLRVAASALALPLPDATRPAQSR